MRALQPLDTRGDVVLAPLSPANRPREILAWAAVFILPLGALLVLALVPSLNLLFENHWFHFQIVSFVSFIAFVVGISTIALLRAIDDVRAFFVLIALGAIAGIFMLHGLATPNVLEIAHAEHNKTQNGLWLRMAQIVAESMIQFQIGEQRFQLKVM